MADQYLNKTGLQYLWNRLKSYFVDKTTFAELEETVDDLVTGGGEPNVIESVSVNSTPQTVTNKNVNIAVPTTVAELTDAADYALAADVPTKLSELTNDGDGTQGSAYATEDYVDTNGGKIDSIKVNGTAQTIANKAVDIAVPTKVSDITNDSGYQTEQEVADAIDEAIAGVTQFDYQVVDALPASGTKGTIYLVPDTNNAGQYKEFIWVNNAWNEIGETGQIDLSDYWSKTELTAITTAEIDTITEAVNG